MTEREMRAGAYLFALAHVLVTAHAYRAGEHASGWVAGALLAGLAYLLSRPPEGSCRGFPSNPSGPPPRGWRDPDGEAGSRLDPVVAVYQGYLFPAFLTAALAGVLGVFVTAVWAVAFGAPWPGVKGAHVVWATWDAYRAAVSSTPKWVALFAIAYGAAAVYRDVDVIRCVTRRKRRPTC